MPGTALIPAALLGGPPAVDAGPSKRSWAGLPASLGVGFLYFAVVESVIRVARPAWAQWLLTDNALALMQRDEYVIYLQNSYVNGNGTFVESGRQIVVSQVHGGVLLTVAALVVVAVGVVLFQRRDLH